MEKRRRGLSTIIATLIVILLVLVAVGIVWVVIRNVIQDSTEQVNLGKFTLDLDLKQVQIVDSDTISVTVKRNPGKGDFVSLNFIIEDGSNTEVVKVNASIEELEQRMFTFDLQDINSGNITKISIAPVFRLESGKEIIGDIKDSLELQPSTSSSPECTLDSQCNDGNSCTTDTCPSGTCVNTAITSCINGDGCCPSGCTLSNDNDCSASCGDSTCDTGECNTCPQDCTHSDCCGDGTCNNGETCGDTDTDPECNTDCDACAAVCGNDVQEGTEECDGTDLAGEDCASQMGTGYTGNLDCYASGLPNECTFDTSSCVPPAGSNPPAYSNLVTWLRFEGDTTDEQGNYDAAIIGTVPYSSGYSSGQSLDFPGSSGNYVNIPITMDYTELTLAFWANMDDVSVLRGFFNYNYNSGYRGRLYYSVAETRLLAVQYAGSGSNPTGEWRHFVYTFDETGPVQIYINGVQNMSRNAGTFDLSATYLQVGKSWTTTEMFDGRIDEFMIYNKVLTPTEISELYAYTP